MKLQTPDQFTTVTNKPKCQNFVGPVIRCTRYCIFVYNFPQNTETLAQVLFGPEFRGRDFDVSLYNMLRYYNSPMSGDRGSFLSRVLKIISLFLSTHSAAVKVNKF